MKDPTKLLGTTEKIINKIMEHWKGNKWFFVGDMVLVLGVSVVGFFAIFGTVFYGLNQYRNWKSLSSGVVFTTSTTDIFTPINSPLSVSGTDNAVAVGQGARATVQKYPPPTFEYYVVGVVVANPFKGIYDESFDGVYTKIFDWKTTYLNGLPPPTGKIVPVSSLSCSPTYPDMVSNQPDRFKTQSLIDLGNNKVVNIEEVTCTSTSPIIDDGKLFKYQDT